MSMRTVLWRWYPKRPESSRRGTKRPLRRGRLRPLLEQLEDRTLLSVLFAPGPVQAPAVNRTDIAPGDTRDGPIEPFVSVNPADPGALAVSSQDGLQVSANAGGPAGFTATTVYPLAPGYVNNQGDTATVYDSQGRLFWANLENPAAGFRDVVVAQVNPATGAIIGNPVPIPHPAGLRNADKQFLAADSNPNSPFADSLYLSLQYFNATDDEFEAYFTRSTDHGVTWSTPQLLSVNSGANTEGFTWPSSVSVAPNGDVYLAYHAQPDVTDTDVEGTPGNNPNGTSGQVIVFRSTDGGATFTQRSLAFTAGNADITFNKQDAANGRLIPGAAFWTIGSAQPWVVADPSRPGSVYVVTADDPNNGAVGNGDSADVVFARSGSNGATWITSTIASGPANSFRLFPNAAIDRFGDIVVSWYTNTTAAGGLTAQNGSGDYLLNVDATYSTDGGLTWAAPFQVNDLAIDPDVAVNNIFAGPPATTRIGEYFGIANYGGTAYVAWRDSNPPAGPSRVLFDAFPINGSLTVSGDDGGGPVNDSFVLRQVAGSPGFIEVLDNGVRQYAGLLAGVAGGIKVNGLGGSDTLTVDFSNGNPVPAGGLDFDGGTGKNQIVLQGGAETADTYMPGLSPGSGSFSITAGATAATTTAATIAFENLSPALDTVPGPLTVDGTPANNAINYSQGSVVANGLVTVDNSEPIEFSNKTTLTLNGLAGDDAFTFNNPNTPTGLTDITANGGDGNDQFLVDSQTPGSPKLHIQGGNNSNTLTVPHGLSGPTAWNITGFNSGSLGGGLNVDFTGVGNLVGPGTYTIGAAGSLSGSIDGLNDPKDNTLVGDNFGDVFSITGPDSGTVTTGLAQDAPIFHNVGNLTGGTGSDTFTFLDGGSLSGGINGGGGTNRINGNSAGDAFLVSGANAGTVAGLLGPGGFSNVQDLTGGAGDDTFKFVTGGSLAGTINGGGAGAVGNTLVGNDAGDSFSVTGANAGTVAGLLGAGGFTNVQGLTGGAGNDTFTFVAGGSLSGGVQGGLGNDNLVVDSTAGPVLGPINYDGGGGGNSLTLTGGTATADTYTPGAQPGSGTNTLTFAAGTETVHFQNLAPIFDSVGGPLAVNGTNGSDAINYAEGDDTTNTLNPAWGQVSVNAAEPMNFTNKTALTLNGLAGDDAFNLNNPNKPTGLTGITVSGGDPTASDTLIVNGTTVADAIGYAPSATVGSGTVTVGGLPAVTFDTVERLTINGQGGNDNLTVTTPAIPLSRNVITLSPGALADAGTVTLRQSAPSGGGPLTGVSFINLGTDNSLGRLSIANASGTRTDSLTVNGVANASETLAVSAAGNIDLLQPVAGTTTRLLLNVQTPGVSQLQLVGLASNDSFTVAGNHPFAAGVLVDGDPGTLNFTGDGTAAVTADLAAGNVTETGFAPVDYTGVGTVNVNAGGAALTINATAGPDNLAYTPTGAASGTVTDAGLSPVFNVSNVTGTFTLDPGAGSDTVTVNGTAGNDAIAVARGATTAVTVSVPSALLTVNAVSANTEALVIDSGLGTDTVSVSGTGGPASLTANGQASPAADTLNVANTTAGTTTVVPGTTDDAGTVRTPDGNVGFTGMRSVGLTGAAAGDTLVGQGTNGDDNIALQFLGGSNRFWVNSQAVVSFASFGTVSLTGGFGNDTFSVAPVGLVGVTAISLAGGDGTDSVVVSGSAAADAITVSPTGPAAATVAIAASAPVSVATIEAVAVNGQGGGDTLTVQTPAGADTVTYSSGPAVDAGAAQVNSFVPLTFSGLGATGGVALTDAGGGAPVDTLQYNGAAGNDTFTVAVPTGVVSANGDVPVTLTGIGILNLDGHGGDNAALFNGSAAAQSFVLTPSAQGNGFSLLHTALPTLSINGTNVGQVNLNTLGAAGSVTVADLSGSGVRLVGLALSPSDAVSLNGTPGGDNVHLAVSAPGVVTVTGLPALVNVSGTAAGDSLAVHGGDGNDTIEATPAVSTLIPLAVDGGPGNDTLFAAGKVAGGGGQDTLDLSSVLGPATVNLDSHSPQTVAPGVTLTLVDTIANFNGSQGVDTVFAAPLAQGRVINGGSGADRLNIDAGSTPLYVTSHAMQLVNAAGSISFSLPMQLSFQNVTLADVSSLIVTTHPYDLVHSRVHRFHQFLLSHKQRFQDLLRLENVSGATALYGPMTLAIYGLPPGVLLKSRTGITLRVGPAGSAFIRLSDVDNLLNPGEQLELPLVFTFRQSALRHLRTLTYYVAVFAGNGLP